MIENLVRVNLPQGDGGKGQDMREYAQSTLYAGMKVVLFYPVKLKKDKNSFQRQKVITMTVGRQVP